MIGIINYGLGNVQAFLNVYKALGIDAISCSSPAQLRSCHHLIIPGVGSFDSAMSKLNTSGMRDCLDSLVLQHHIPVLGVCVGFQIMAHSSEEGYSNGLSWLDASIKNLASENRSTFKLPLPHMGWNTVDFYPKEQIFSDIDKLNSRFYFLHSFYFDPIDEDLTIAKSTYGICFSCAASLGNIYGVQFHPEKSHTNGVLLLRNFSNL